ncbi:hypothetical protein BGZ80_002118 [Entomortierella chlamydospora]|uniref:BTB domain-containing protein n=1 Tax=Entomortierella chlamydospora TaxID=101097 RepID=A0A9P6SXB5_9FUNG|nr:hypothetical protein BGZ80_002118 [Entomortierella chlamydospora]
MTNEDLCTFHFRISDNPHLLPSTPGRSTTDAAPPKTDTHGWSCQLSVLEDKSTLRATFGTSEANRIELKPCISLQIIAAYGLEHEPDRVLLSKRVKSEHLFKRGIEYREDVWVDQHYEFYIILSSHPVKLLGPFENGYSTHTLALSECDPVARNVDPLVEMMTQFERHSATSDVEYRFVSKEGLVLDRMRAHHSILSIYPSFSEKLTLAQSNPHQRTSTTVLVAPIEAWGTFERMFGFIYSGRLPREGFVPRSSQWGLAFELSREYGLEKCTSSSPWMEWHLSELRQVITDENVLELYFGWGYEYATVAGMCVRHVAERSQVHFQGGDLGSHIMGLLRDKYQGFQGCNEFQEALVVQSMKMYAQQQSIMA